jgi:hypothetical protein
LIIFSNLVAHRERFEAKKAEFAQYRKAKKVLDRLAKMNPDFFPIPFDFGEQASDRFLCEPYLGDGALTCAEVAPLFDAVSQVVHVLNPLNQQAEIDLVRPVAEWAARIDRLMDRHFVRLSNRHLLLVQMNGPDGKVHVASAQADGETRWTGPFATQRA